VRSISSCNSITTSIISQQVRYDAKLVTRLTPRLERHGELPEFGSLNFVMRVIVRISRKGVCTIKGAGLFGKSSEL
jgi:hypothetical protein